VCEHAVLAPRHGGPVRPADLPALLSDGYGMKVAPALKPMNAAQRKMLRRIPTTG
jgi:hypothetical protein